MGQRNAILANGNQLKLGLFGANCSSGRAYIVAPERWETTWENNVRLAQLADDAGMECMVPIARWKGYGGEGDPNGTSWESITWACGLLAATKRINVFATVHVPLNPPVLAAKQMVTADHIGQGRFGVNVVCGWNEDEHRMFGVSVKEHEARYEQGAEWWTIVKKLWAGEGPFDSEGQFYRLSGLRGSPVPYGGSAPTMMNAGSSPAGRAFAIRYSDMHFDGVRAQDETVHRIAETKRQAREAGREVQVWTPIGIVCRATQREADTFAQYVVDHADAGAIRRLEEVRHQHGDNPQMLEQTAGRHEVGPLTRLVVARGNFCAIGEPDWVAQELARLRGMGFDGLVIHFVNYLDEFPYFAQEVLPRLERLGLRSQAIA
jgi:FMNH2-dependent dimethyl sulfone monooxygenase